MSRDFSRPALLLILLLGFGLRLFRLDFQELRGDEAFGYFFSLRSFAGIVQDTLALHEPHPVASYFLQKVWYGLAGTSEFALRLPAALAGTAAIALTFRLGRQLRLPRPGPLLASLLLAASAYAVWHSQDARMYALSLALTLAVTGLAVALLARPGWSVAAGYAAAALLALHTHYFAGFVLLALNFYTLLLLLRRRLDTTRLLAWAGVQAAVALVYAPWLLAAGQTLRSYRGNGDSPPFGPMLWRSFGVFAVGESVPEDWRLYAALLAGGLLLAGLFGAVLWRRAGHAPAQKQPHAPLLLLLLVLLVPLLATWASAQSRPIFNERYLIPALPPFLLLLTAGAVRLGRIAPGGWLRVAVPAGLMAVLLAANLLSLQNHFFDPAYSKTRGWRALATALERWSAGLPADDVRLAQNFPDPVLWYYYAGEIGHLVLPPAPQDAPGAGAAVEALARDGVRRVLLPVQPAPHWDATGIAPAALGRVYALAAQEQIDVWPLQLYTRPDPAAWQPVARAFANGLVLDAVQIAPDAPPAGGVLAVHLRWRAEPAAIDPPDVISRLNGNEKLFLHLLDEAGTLVTQLDPPLALTALPATVSYGLPIPGFLPAGSLRLVAGVYDPTAADAARIPLQSGGDALELAEFPR